METGEKFQLTFGDHLVIDNREFVRYYDLGKIGKKHLHHFGK